MNDRPMNQKVNVTFFKTTGKYYTSGEAFVNHFQYDDEYRQDIVNTQNAMGEGWQGSYFVVVSSDDDAVGFHEALFKPEDFAGIKRRSETK